LRFWHQYQDYDEGDDDDDDDDNNNNNNNNNTEHISRAK
jgi:hypothetical protein